MPYARKRSYGRKRSAGATARRRTKKYAKKSYRKKSKRTSRRSMFSFGNATTGSSMISRSRLVNLEVQTTYVLGTQASTLFAPTSMAIPCNDISNLEDYLTGYFGKPINVPGYSLMTTLYQRFSVVGFKMTAKILDREDAVIDPLVPGTSWNSTDAYAHGFVVDQIDLSTGQFPNGYEYNTYEEMVTHKYAKAAVVTGTDIAQRSSAPTLSQGWSMKKYFGLSQAKDNQQLYGGKFKTAIFNSGAMNSQSSAVRMRHFCVPIGTNVFSPTDPGNPMRWTVELKMKWSVLCQDPNEQIAGL